MTLLEENAELKRRLADSEKRLGKKEELETALRRSEERFGIAIDIGGLATWDWDLYTGHLTWNDRHFLMQGYAVGEVTPSFEAWLARVHPDDRDETVRMIEVAQDEHAIYVHSFRTLWPDATVCWCSAQGRFFYDADGAPSRMVGVMEDITDRKRTEAALLQSEVKYRSLFENLGQGFAEIEFIRDAEGRVTICGTSP